MMSYATPANDQSRSRSDQALRWIGDLDHPFYSDERNRYVWYEASAIAFQLLFLGSYFTTGAVLWVAGADALPYALAFFIPTMATIIVFQSYLKRNSAEYWPGKNDIARRRGQLAILAAVFLLSGTVRAMLDLNSSATSGDSSFSTGLIGGAIAGSLAAVAAIAYKRNQANKAELEDDF